MRTSKPLPKNFWTQVRIVKCMKALKREGHPLTVKSIYKDHSRKTNQVLFNLLEYKASGSKLYLAALRHFGSWDRALTKAGINAETVRLKQFSWNKRSIPKVLKVLFYSNVKINAGNLSRDRSTITKEIIHRSTGQKITGARLYTISNKVLGDYNNVIKLAGLKISQVRKPGLPCRKNKDDIIHYLRIFDQKNFELNRTAIAKNTQIMKYFIEDIVGLPISGMSVFNSAKHVFGNWRNTFINAGLDPEKSSLRASPHLFPLSSIEQQSEHVVIDGTRRKVTYFGSAPETPDDIIEKIEARNKFNSLLGVLSDEDQEMLQLITDALGQIHLSSSESERNKHIAFILGNSFSEHDIEQFFLKLRHRFQ